MVKKQKLNEDKTNVGSCGCGRSPTGSCCGWHGLSEDEYRQQLAIYEDRQTKQTNNQPTKKTIL